MFTVGAVILGFGFLGAKAAFSVFELVLRAFPKKDPVIKPLLEEPFPGHKEYCWQDYRWHKEHRPESLPQLSAFLKETYGYDTSEW